MYAGFWKRAGAIIIDGIIISVVQGIILFIVGLTGSGLLMNLFSLLLSIAAICYFAYMESMPKYQGTIGKIILGIKVTDLNGGQLNFVQALIRNLCKIISSVILGIGYIMAAFTEKKQALHDILAKTLVVNK
ncbi:putative RDD family membrane protein YckC [Elusimicrobium simillimum]|uniref:RDD family protein n=1 Tax=Elusimicrobium simillimum TaxID=3143438 RepID=UPI003C6F02EC